MHRPSRWPPLASILAVLALAIGAIGSGVGCGVTETAPQLLDLVDFTPREAEVGDKLEVIGSGLPEGRAARVTFKGTLRRPGKEPIPSFETDVDAVSSSADRVQIAFTDPLEEVFCGAGEQAEHTTFEGDVMVSFPAATPGALPVTGSVRHIVVDFRPPAPRRAVLRAREAEGDRVLAFLGITTPDHSDAAGGLPVTAVRPGSAAEGAGIVAGDVLTSLDGVRIFGKSDVIPNGASRYALVGIRPLAGGGEQVRSVSIEGYRPAAPVNLLVAGLVLAVMAALVLLWGAPLSSVAAWIERRFSARMHARAVVGRGGAGHPSPWGAGAGFGPGPGSGSDRASYGDRARTVGRWLMDVLRAVLRQDVAPAGDEAPVVRVAPYLVFVGASSAFCALPFGQHLVAADLDIGVLFMVGAIALATISLISGGIRPRGSWSLFGGLRCAAQVMSCEVPGALAIAAVVMMTGSLRMQDIVRAQGGMPWDWFVFRSPVTFALFFLWFATALAEPKRSFSDLPELEGAPAREPTKQGRSAARYLFFFFAEWANVLVMSGLGAALFLGGWQIPGVDPLAEEASFGLECVGAAVFQLKTWLLVLLVVSIRWALPRVHFDQMMSVCWKWLVPASVAALLLTGGWMLWNPMPVVQRIVALGTFSVWVALVGWLAYRVQCNLRATQAPAHLNPFL